MSNRTIGTVARATETVRTRGRMSRRTIIKGAAWSVPVIAAAAAVPTATASGTGTLVFSPGPGALNSDNDNFTYTWTLTNSSTTDPISGPFTIAFNVPYNIQNSIPKPSAGQASASNPTLFAPIAVNASSGYSVGWTHQDGVSDAYGNTRTETITVGNASSKLAAGASITVSTIWSVPNNWLSTGEGSILLSRRIWTWQSAGTVSAASGTLGSPQAFPGWTTGPATENPASPGGLWAFSTPAG
ncbi:hypothetical protein [Microbacterium sp. 22242]|uniref:hypothetical protein n=1 Tax=Microbacterium sp. 22242 TaxID=3453896 RepID=UPI003F86A2C5